LSKEIDIESEMHYIDYDDNDDFIILLAAEQGRIL